MFYFKLFSLLKTNKILVFNFSPYILCGVTDKSYDFNKVSSFFTNRIVCGNLYLFVCLFSVLFPGVMKGILSLLRPFIMYVFHTIISDSLYTFEGFHIRRFSKTTRYKNKKMLKLLFANFILQSTHSFKDGLISFSPFEGAKSGEIAIVFDPNDVNIYGQALVITLTPTIFGTNALSSIFNIILKKDKK